jgi:hypothetical protein
LSITIPQQGLLSEAVGMDKDGWYINPTFFLLKGLSSLSLYPFVPLNIPSSSSSLYRDSNAKFILCHNLKSCGSSPVSSKCRKTDPANDNLIE